MALSASIANKTTMKFICTLCLIFCFSYAHSQALVKPTVEIDVRSGAFKTSLPFDESFNIRGELAYSTRRVILKYGPVDVTKERKYFATPKGYKKNDRNNGDIEFSREYYVKTGETEFLFSEIGPLRPNIAYKFNFTTLAKNTISTNELSFLRQEIEKKLTNTLTGAKPLNLQNITELHDQVLTMASEVTHEENFVDAKSEPFKIDNYKKALNFFSYRLLDVHNAISSYRQKVDSVLDSTGSNSLYFNLQQIIPKLIALNSGSIPLADYPRQALASAGNGSTRQAVTYLESTLFDKAGFKQILFNETGSSITATDSSKLGSLTALQNLIKTLNVLSMNEFTKLDKSKVFTSNEVNSLIIITESLNKLLDYQSSFVTANQSLVSLKSELLDVIVHAYGEESFILASAAEFEVTPKHNPYVALDLGGSIIFNPYKNSEGSIGNNTYFSLNEGVNIYFSPVNKLAPLSMFKWPYNFYKAFNIHIGVAQILGGFNTYRFQNSLGWFGNLVAGVGFRFNNTTKIGINATFVNLRNINPTVNQSKLKPMFGVSFSFDINVAKRFNGSRKYYQTNN